MTGRRLHRDALATLRALEESGTAAEVSSRVEKMTGVPMSSKRVTHLLDHLGGCCHALRQGHGEAATYIRLGPGEDAVRAEDTQRAAARARGVLS